MSGHFCWWILNPWSDTCYIDMASTAAWLQFLGAVGALFLTMHLYKKQIEANSNEKQASRTERRRSQALVANQFADVANELIVEIIGHYSAGSRVALDFAPMKNLAIKMDDAIIWSRIFVVDTFTEAELKSFIKVRGTLHTISTWALQSRAGVLSKSPNYISNLYNGIHADLAVLMAAK